MKPLLLAALVLPTVLFAQLAQPVQLVPARPPIHSGSQTPNEPLPDNYQVTLIITDKDVPPMEVAVVVASRNFNLSLGEPGLTFRGTLAVEESGNIVIEYSLGWTSLVPNANNVETRQSNTNGSVRLKLGEEVQIIRTGTRLTRIWIKKLETPK